MKQTPCVLLVWVALLGAGCDNPANGRYQVVSAKFDDQEGHNQTLVIKIDTATGTCWRYEAFLIGKGDGKHDVVGWEQIPSSMAEALKPFVKLPEQQNQHQ